MKTTFRKAILILVLCLPFLFLTACEDADWDLLEIAFEAWAEENHLLENGKWQPEGVVQKAVENTIADITNQEESIQFDGLDVIQDIEQADNLAEEALEDLDADKMTTAISIRPNDWRLLEQDGVVWLANANGAAAQNSFTKSDEMLRRSLQSGGDCFALRRSQLETRLFTLSDAITTAKAGNTGAYDIEALQAENRRVADELTIMANSGQSAFCE